MVSVYKWLRLDVRHPSSGAHHNWLGFDQKEFFCVSPLFAVLLRVFCDLKVPKRKLSSVSKDQKMAFTVRGSILVCYRGAQTYVVVPSAKEKEEGIDEKHGAST